MEGYSLVSSTAVDLSAGSPERFVIASVANVEIYCLPREA